MRNFRTVDQDGKVVEPPKPAEEVVARDPSSDVELLRLKKLLEEMRKADEYKRLVPTVPSVPYTAPEVYGTLGGMQTTTSPYVPPSTIYYVNSTGIWTEGR